MKNNNWNYVPVDITAIMGVVDTTVRWSNTQGPPRTYTSYHPSELGKCLRAMQYKLYEALGLIKIEKEAFDSKLLRLFGKGHNMHARWTNYFRDAGVLRGYWRCVNPTCSAGRNKHGNWYGQDKLLGDMKPQKCDCGSDHFDYEELVVKNEELNVYGHSDMVLDFSNFDISKYLNSNIELGFIKDDLPKKPVVVDMKTINDRGFSEILRNGPHFAYQIQLNVYANILDCEYGLLIYENKNDSRLASFKIEKNTETVFVEIQKQLTLMNQMVQSKILPPPRPIYQDSYECRYCPFSKICLKSAIWDKKNLKDLRNKFYGGLLQK